MVTNRPELLRLVLAAVAVSCGLALVAALNLSQAQPATEYQPSVGQEGKDVVWVPTDLALVDKMLDLAAVTASDFLIDLGSGDGRTVIAAAKRGAKALGIEFNPELVELSRRNAAKEGIADRAAFMQGDVFDTDFSKATVITLFLLPELNLRLRPKISRYHLRVSALYPIRSIWTTGCLRNGSKSLRAAHVIALPFSGSFPRNWKAGGKCRAASSH